MEFYEFQESEVVDIINECFKVSDHVALTVYNIGWFSGLKQKNSSLSVRWLQERKHYLQRKYLNIFGEDILLAPETKTPDFLIYDYCKEKIDSPIAKIKISFKADEGRVFGDFTFVRKDDDLFWTESFWVCANTQRDLEQQRISWILDAAKSDDLKRFIINKILPLSLK